MKLTNVTKGVVLAEEARLADSFLKRLTGLLGKKKLAKSQALIIKPCNSIHTFFMHFPIDVLFVNKNNAVIKVILGLKPFRLSGIYFNAAYAVELPPGTVGSSLSGVGDILSIG